MKLFQIIISPLIVPLFPPRENCAEEVSEYIKKFSQSIGNTQSHWNNTIIGSYFASGANAGFVLCMLKFSKVDTFAIVMAIIGALFCIHFFIQAQKLSVIKPTS